MKNKSVISLDATELLRNYIKKHRIFKAALARKMQVDYKTVIKSLKVKTIAFEKLVSFCHALQYNFIYDLALQLPASYGRDTSVLHESEKEITQLKENNQRLLMENEILRKLLNEATAKK